MKDLDRLALLFAILAVLVSLVALTQGMRLATDPALVATMRRHEAACTAWHTHERSRPALIALLVRDFGAAAPEARARLDASTNELRQICDGDVDTAPSP